MSKSAIFHRPQKTDSHKTLGNDSGSDIGWSCYLAESESGKVSVLRECAGCGRGFVPAGAQKYCDHDCYSASLRTPIESRFWAHVNKHDPSGCWLWTASTVRGYGQVTLPRENGKQRKTTAHRMAWELLRGPIPNGQFVLHVCDVPLCCNVAHLFLGTQQDNLNDARRKGRLVDGLDARKLSDDAYRDILSTPPTRGSSLLLQRRYGVTKTTISRIRRGVQGLTFHRSVRAQAVLNSPFERVASVQLEIRGEVA
jgi:hypothetical protein